MQFGQKQAAKPFRHR